MKDLAKLILVLTLISAVAGLLLGVTSSVTRDPIAAAKQQETLDALAAVLPEFDNQPDLATNVVREAGSAWTFYVARKGGAFSGAAFVASSKKGYAGLIQIMVGVAADGTVRKARVLLQNETPGLGTRIKEPSFIDQFAGWLMADPLKLKKDGGRIDAITGATISSRAVTTAIADGLDVYRRNEESIRETRGGEQ